MTVKNDRFGFFPLFYYHKGGQFGLSSSISTLVAKGADTELDFSALAVALRIGQFIGEDTAFRHIRALPPNAQLVWKEGRLAVSGGEEIRSTALNIRREDAIRVYLELFRKSIQRRLCASDDFVVPLTGGRDSRHILFELVQNGFLPKACFTVKMYPADVRTAALVCQTLGINHSVIDQSTTPFLTEVEKNWLTNFGVDEGAYPLALRDALKREGISTVYDGIGGDVLSAGLFLDESLCNLFARGSVGEIAQTLSQSSNEHIWNYIVSKPFLDRCSKDAAITRLSVEIEKHLQAHNPVTSFYFWNRTRRKIALTPYALLSGVENVFAPYLDHELFDFLYSLPTDLLIDHTFHTDAIRAGYPQWSNIPFEDKLEKDYDFSAQHARFAKEFSSCLLGRRLPRLLRVMPFYLRSLRVFLGNSFAATDQWYFRRATWLHQLGVLSDRGNGWNR